MLFEVPIHTEEGEDVPAVGEVEAVPCRRRVSE
jgi:hypothetical protein